jgi:Mg-chelatase subunit ChlD
MVLLSIQIASADMLNLTAGTNETFADNRTAQITANLTNATGYPINGTRVNFTADCGILSAGYNYTNASGIAVVNISSWDLCTAKITAEAGAANATVNVTFVSGPISQIILSADSSGTVNTTHQVTVTVYDKTRDEFANNESRWRVMPNVTLNFNATSPPPNQWNSPDDDYSASVSPSPSTTDENGTTTVTMYLSSRAGTNRLDVNVTNEEGEEVTEYLEIVGIAGEATTLTVTASPENVSANGIDISHIIGKVTDGFGNPLLSTGAIRFNVTGSAPIIKPLNSVGQVTISIGPSKFTGNVAVNGTYINVTGEYTNITDSVTVIFYEEEPVRVVVTADATKISTSNIPGVNTSTIIATVIDKWGHTIPGRTVNFSLTGPGTLSAPTGTTDSRGQVMITLQSDTAGDATVTAKVLNDSGYEIKGSIAIRILDKPFISVITTIEPDPVAPGGIINVTTSVSGQGDITGIYLAAHAMLTLDRSGSMDPDYYAGTPLDVVLVTDVSGSMDPDYMHRLGENQFEEEGFASYNVHANGSVNTGSWSDNLTFTVNATPVNDFNTRLYWYTGGDDDLRLQLISPSGLVYGYQGTAPGYDYYNSSGLRECVWIDLANYSHPSSADTDTLEQGTWTVRVYNTASASLSFDITTHIERLSAAKIASKEFNRNMVSNSRVGLVSCGGDNGSGKRINTYSLSGNISYINERSDALWAYGGTPTADAIQAATNNLVSNQRTGARPYIILLSDGKPTIALDGSYDAEEATADAISEADITKNTVINGYDIKIYAIGFGTDAGGNDTMESIASQDCYYYAATIDQLQEIYYNIAQQISDFDITTRQYGVQGFTTYRYDAHGTVNGTFTDTFIINETINDFKVEIDNPNLNFTITSPSDTTYPDPAKGGYVNRTGYYETDSGKYIWLTPLSGQYPLTDADTVEKGAWTITITGSGEFNITTYIDKKSAAKIASHAFIDSLSPVRYDRVGLATYSYSSANETATQESYVCQGNQWEGYFTVDSYATHYFNLSWADASDLDLYLYDGITLLDSSDTSNPEMVSAALSPGINYRIVVNGTNVIGNDTQFTINVYSTIETVNSGTSAVPLESTTVDIPPVDLNKTFLIVKSSDDLAVDSNAYAFTIRGHFIDNDTIEFTRGSSSGEGEVSYFVIQADNIEVQSGTTTFSKVDSQKNVSITAVTDHTTKCFVALSTSSNSKSRKYIHESWVTGELTANDTLTLTRAASGISEVTVDWFVIRFTDNTTVQTGNTSWSGASATTQTIAPINTSRTWLYFTSRMDNNGLAHTSIKGEITNQTTLTFSKHSDSSAGTDYVRYFVIEFPDDSGATVQSGTASAGSGDSTVDIGITPVNRKRALAFVTNDCEGIGTTYAMPYWISYFTSDSNLKMQRWYTGEPVVHKWQVVEWPEGTSVGIADTTVNWLEWQAKIDNSLDDSIVSFTPIKASIEGLTADGMTAIDEGLCEANNALYDYFAAVSKPIDNGTIVLMTDGIDNVGYHSMIAEAERAAANNTTIFTVGFGADIDDRVLRQIANITGGGYYFAPNATVLKNIFVGIAGELGNFTAPEPRIYIRIGNNATVEGAFANVTYINNSANVMYFNCTLADCSEGQYEYEYLNPNVTYIGNRTILSWDIGNRPDRIITVGEYWNVTYQLRIDNESAGYVPIILYPSCVTYEGAGGEGNCSNNLVPDVNVDVTGNGTPPSPKPANSIEIANKSVSGGPPFRPSPKPDTVQEYAYRLTAYLEDVDENPVVFGTVVEFRVASASGTLYNYTLHNTSGLLNGTTGLGGAAIVWLSSDVPGTITVCAHHTTANGTELTPACNVVIFHSLESPPIIPPAPRPRGVITLESDPFMEDWLSLLWRNRSCR